MLHKLNKQMFKGKVVLDVGCGTGILSLFAAQAGAKAVYCVELTQISRVARVLAQQNGFGHIITVLQGKIEEVTLPTQQVDIIISEWMGYFCLFEGMFRSVIWARDKYLVAGGHMLPDKLDMYVGAGTQAKVNRKEKSLAKWDKAMYGLDLSALGQVLADWKEHETTQLTHQWRTGTYPEIAQIEAAQMLSVGKKVVSIDMQSVDANGLDQLVAPVELAVHKSGEFDRVVGWFNAYFTRGGKEVFLGTGPESKATHWHQMVFHLNQGYQVSAGDELPVRLNMDTAAAYRREMRVVVELGIPPKDGRESEIRAKEYTVVILPDTSQWARVGHGAD
jgi:protein arginine N-methyltransferase 1